MRFFVPHAGQATTGAASPDSICLTPSMSVGRAVREAVRLSDRCGVADHAARRRHAPGTAGLFDGLPQIRKVRQRLLSLKFTLQTTVLALLLKRFHGVELVDRQAFFSEPHCAADYTYWSTRQQWTTEEAVALLLGKDPLAVRWDTLRAFQGRSKFAAEYETLLAQLKAAESEWGNEKGRSPMDYVSWAVRVGREVPSAFHDLFEPARLHGHERTSLLKLVVGMAIAQYGYDPTQKKSDVPRKIVGDLNLLGLKVDVDTVRKHLQAGAKLAPETE